MGLFLKLLKKKESLVAAILHINRLSPASQLCVLAITTPTTASFPFENTS